MNRVLKFRNELKYYLNKSDYINLSMRLKYLLQHDPHADEYGDYHIRSLYFDDMYNSAALDKLAGVDNRQKYRIRIYNKSDRRIMLERKDKKGSYIHKVTMPLSIGEYEDIIAGDPTVLLSRHLPLANMMYVEMRVNRLAPVKIVDYTREAYVHHYQDVRITFDKQLASANFKGQLFGELFTIPADNYGIIMEIKFNDFLPQFIYEFLKVDNYSRQAISKYVICRSND